MRSEAIAVELYLAQLRPAPPPGARAAGLRRGAPQEANLWVEERRLSSASPGSRRREGAVTTTVTEPAVAHGRWRLPQARKSLKNGAGGCRRVCGSRFTYRRSQVRVPYRPLPPPPLPPAALG